MTYSRPPVQAGRGLTRKPSVPVSSTAGVFDYSLDADIATSDDLGLVQIGTGLSITPEGVLSATGGGSSLINVYLTDVNYTATDTDYYIGVTEEDVIITFPLGITGKVYIVKNQAKGNISVRGSSGQKLDKVTVKTLGTDASMIAVFDGLRWNLV